MKMGMQLPKYMSAMMRNFHDLLVIFFCSGSSQTVHYKMIDLGGALRVHHSRLGDKAVTRMENVPKIPGREGFPG